MATAPALDISRHKCLIYDGHPSEQLPVVIPFLIEGLRTNWRCMYLGSPEMVRMVDSALIRQGVDPGAEIERGTLLLSSDRSHLVGDSFDPQKMVKILSEMVDEAVEDGFDGLCATGDMVWELGAPRNFDRLLEYEAQLESLFREKPLRGICQYQRAIVPAQAVRDALVTHRSTFVGGVLNRDNIFYMPPELLLEPDRTTASKQGEWMCKQIVRVLKAEENRDEALRALEQSEVQQRRLAQQLAEANRNLEVRVRQRTAELEEANRHLEAFSYSLSHDLRQPLQSIVGFSELLREEHGQTLGAKGREQLGRLNAGAARIAELIDGMLMLSGVSRGDLNFVSVDLSQMAREAATDLQEREPGRCAEFVIHAGMQAVGDRALIGAVLANLMGNAWKFSSKLDWSRIEVGQEIAAGGSTIFYVKDNGAGFDMQRSRGLFRAFERLHKQEEFPGSGIGLATVQRIILRHGGRLWAQSRPDEGATFFFTLQDEAFKAL